MTRRQKFWMYGGIAFVICSVLILATAYGQGADPLHPRTRHIWALSLVAAAYVSFRGSLLIEKLTDAESSETRKPSMFSQVVTGRRHAIDERMDARRQRVAAARAKRGSADATGRAEDEGEMTDKR